MNNGQVVKDALSGLIAEVATRCMPPLYVDAVREVVRDWKGRTKIDGSFIRFRHGWFVAKGLVALALLPTFVTTSTPNTKTLTTVEVVASVEAPQVGFEPTTLRLTVAEGSQNCSFLHKGLGRTPVLGRSYGTALDPAGPADSPRQSPRGAVWSGGRRR